MPLLFKLVEQEGADVCFANVSVSACDKVGLGHFEFLLCFFSNCLLHYCGVVYRLL